MASIPQKKITLYLYVNRLNGKRYVGVTNDTIARSAAHAKGKSNALAFNGAVQKHGIDAFDYKVLAIFDDADAAAYHEQAAILVFGTLAPAGYNLRAGAPFTSYNGTLVQEARAKIGVANSRRIITPESRAKMSKAHMGNQHRRGKPLSAETKAKMSAAHSGRKHSAESRAKISKALKGRKLSAEHIAKMSAAAKARHAEKEH